jgi:ADP-heptose:LPS heptosyltransferase
MRALVAALTARGRRVVVTGGPNEAALTALVANGAPGAIDLGGTTDLTGLTGVLAAADVLVCGNTGPAHLAAAVGTPVVDIYAPTVPASRWRPWRVAHVLLGEQDIACRDCRARVCPVPGHPCIDDVSIEAVLEAVDQLAPQPVRHAVTLSAGAP